MSVSLYPLRHVRHFGTSDKTQRLSSTTRIIRRGHGFLQRCGELWLRKYREKKVARGISMSGIQKRATQQLATVYKALQGDHSHPSAGEIYQRVRQTLPRISLGTVYRDLQRLVEERKIRMLLLGERVARYDPVLAAHDHFICQQCGRVEDVLLERDRRMTLAPLMDEGFTVTAHSISIHGFCQSCGRKWQRKCQARRG